MYHRVLCLFPLIAANASLFQDIGQQLNADLLLAMFVRNLNAAFVLDHEIVIRTFAWADGIAEAEFLEPFDEISPL